MVPAHVNDGRDSVRARTRRRQGPGWARESLLRSRPKGGDSGVGRGTKSALAYTEGRDSLTTLDMSAVVVKGDGHGPTETPWVDTLSILLGWPRVPRDDPRPIALCVDLFRLQNLPGRRHVRRSICRVSSVGAPHLLGSTGPFPGIDPSPVLGTGQCVRRIWYRKPGPYPGVLSGHGSRVWSGPSPSLSVVSGLPSGDPYTTPAVWGRVGSWSNSPCTSRRPQSTRPTPRPSRVGVPGTARDADEDLRQREDGDGSPFPPECRIHPGPQGEVGVTTMVWSRTGGSSLGSRKLRQQ